MKTDFGKLVAELARVNVELWHEEDKARSPDDIQVAQAKRKIDQLNQKRNNLIEAIDDCALGMLVSPSRKRQRGKNG